MTPMVQVLMNCRNGEKYVEQALQSIRQQTFSDWEVIFIDNQSSDRSALIARDFDSRVRIIKTPHDMSLCEGRVFAKPYLTAPYICVLDVDDVWLPNKLATQIQIMESNPHVGVCYANTIYFNNDGDIRLAYKKPMPQGKIFRQLLRGYFISLETIMIRNRVLQETGLHFSSRYNLSSDMELLTKLSYFTEFAYTHGALAKWRFGHGNLSAHQLQSFPAEYETLMQDLAQLIPTFSQEYAEEIRRLKGVVHNMYGLSHWRSGDKVSTVQRMAQATRYHKKYVLPWLGSHFLTYEQYRKVLRLMGKEAMV